jgi:hypothetical protein
MMLIYNFLLGLRLLKPKLTFFGKSIEETSAEIIQRTEQELVAKGPELLEQYMTEKMWLAYVKGSDIHIIQLKMCDE